MTLLPLADLHLGDLSALEWVVVGLSAVAALGVIVAAVRLTLRPREDAPDHIKRMILDEPKDAADAREGPRGEGRPRS